MAVNKTREDYRKEKEIDKEEVVRPTKNRIRIRFLPIWLRLVLLVVFICIFMIAGSAVGYGLIGNGKASDVLKLSTWTHIRDLVDKK